MPNASFEGLYTLQNDAIDNTGTISIVGIPETTMTGTTSNRQQSSQQWVLKQPIIVSIEQLDTLRINKWWLIHKKAKTGIVQAFVDDKLHSYLKTNYLELNLDNIQHKYTRQTNAREPNPKIDALIQHLRDRTPPIPVTKPHTAGRYQKYSDATTANTTKYAVKTQALPAAIRHLTSQGSIGEGTPSTMTPPNQEDAIKNWWNNWANKKQQWKQNKLNGKLSYSPNLRT